MNEAQKKAYASKYFRTGAEVRLPKEENPYPQMKYDSVRLQSTPDFGNLNTASYWQYICAPLAMPPEPKRNDRGRYLTLMGGDMRNALNLEGTVEITIGRDADELATFTFDKAVTAYIPPGMLYRADVRQIKNAKFPILYNEFAFGPSVGDAFGDLSGYGAFFKSGESLWAKNRRHLETNLPSLAFCGAELGGKQPVCRRWTPLTRPNAPEPGTHAHDFDQFVTFTGTDPERMLDLGGEIELTIGEEGKELITFSSSVACQFFIPKGLQGFQVLEKRSVRLGFPLFERLERLKGKNARPVFFPVRFKRMMHAGIRF
jgi:hypothetical protein